MQAPDRPSKEIKAHVKEVCEDFINLAFNHKDIYEIHFTIQTNQGPLTTMMQFPNAEAQEFASDSRDRRAIINYYLLRNVIEYNQDVSDVRILLKLHDGTYFFVSDLPGSVAKVLEEDFKPSSEPSSVRLYTRDDLKHDLENILNRSDVWSRDRLENTYHQVTSGKPVTPFYMTTDDLSQNIPTVVRD